MYARNVTESDFRMPEFKNAKVEEYEFRSDGKLVRKDRWECAVGSIRFLVGISEREFEIADVIDAVHTLAGDADAWLTVDDGYPDDRRAVDVRLADESVLRHAFFPPPIPACHGAVLACHGAAVLPAVPSLSGATQKEKLARMMNENCRRR